MRSLASVLVFASLATALLGCAASPHLRSALPPGVRPDAAPQGTQGSFMDLPKTPAKPFTPQVGVALYGAGAANLAGAGAAGFGLLTLGQGFDIVLTGAGMSGTGLPSLGLGGASATGGGGLRYRAQVIRDLYGVAEGTFDAEYIYSSTLAAAPHQMFVGVTGRLGVTQRVAGDFWAYVVSEVGIRVPLQTDSRPFFGIMRAPLGLVWQMTDQITWVAEGGFWPPFEGGYGSVGAVFTF